MKSQYYGNVCGNCKHHDFENDHCKKRDEHRFGSNWCKEDFEMIQDIITKDVWEEKEMMDKYYTNKLLETIKKL